MLLIPIKEDMLYLKKVRGIILILIIMEIILMILCHENGMMLSQNFLKIH